MQLSAVISLFKKASPPIQLSSPSTRVTPLPPVVEVDEDPEVSNNPSVQPATPTSPAQGSIVPESIARVLSSQSAATTQTIRSTHTYRSVRSNTSNATRRTAAAMNEDKDPSSPRLDLNTARVSLMMELATYTMMATATTGTMFTAYTAFGSLGAGFTPAVQSLALGIYAGRGGEETGKLFGGLSVVHALGYAPLTIHYDYVY